MVPSIISFSCSIFLAPIKIALTVFLFFSHVFINVGMVMGLLPVVGVPLPLISYGGSSMLATMISFGLIMNCYINRDIILAKEGFID